MVELVDTRGLSPRIRRVCRFESGSGDCVVVGLVASSLKEWSVRRLYGCVPQVTRQGFCLIEAEDGSERPRGNLRLDDVVLRLVRRSRGAKSSLRECRATGLIVGGTRPRAFGVTARHAKHVVSAHEQAIAARLAY